MSHNADQFPRPERYDVRVSQSDLDLMYGLWPENFAVMYEMSVKAFIALFHLNPEYKEYFKIAEGDDWVDSGRLKKILLSLEQLLTLCVNTYADKSTEKLHTPQMFAKLLQEAGGMHRHIVPFIKPDAFEKLFKILPEVITDITVHRSPSGPISEECRCRLNNVWHEACELMWHNFLYGWERNVIPTTEKYQKAYFSGLIVRSLPDVKGKEKLNKKEKKNERGRREDDHQEGSSQQCLPDRKRAQSSGAIRQAAEKFSLFMRRSSRANDVTAPLVNGEEIHTSCLSNHRTRSVGGIEIDVDDDSESFDRVISADSPATENDDGITLNELQMHLPD